MTSQRVPILKGSTAEDIESEIKETCKWSSISGLKKRVGGGKWRGGGGEGVQA